MENYVIKTKLSVTAGMTASTRVPNESQAPGRTMALL